MLPSSLLKLPNIDRCRVYLLNNIQYYPHNKLYLVCTCVSSYLLQQGITIQTAGLSLQTLCRDRCWKWCTERNFTEASRGRVSNYITCICNTILFWCISCALACENSWYFVMPPLVSMWNDFCGTTAEVLYWWSFIRHMTAIQHFAKYPCCEVTGKCMHLNTLLFLFDIDLPLLKPRLNKESSFLRERNLKKKKNLWRNKKLMWLLFVCERKIWVQLCLREEEGQEKSKKQYSPPLFQLLQFIPERF